MPEPNVGLAWEELRLAALSAVKDAPPKRRRRAWCDRSFLFRPKCAAVLCQSLAEGKCPVCGKRICRRAPGPLERR